MKSRTLTTEFIIERFKKIYGDLYDYSETVYEHHKKKIIIICKVHGKFFKTELNHRYGQGCPACATKHYLNTEKFISRAIEIHGSIKYDYSEVNYKQINKKVKIKCLIHNSYFYQSPTHHLDGAGCPLCSYEARKYTTEEFITNSLLIHGNSHYDYSDVIYKGIFEKVKIKCLVHNLVFYQTPHKHLQGQGCKECGKEKTKNSISYDTEKFIEKAKETHGELYDYSLSIYTKGHEKLKIVCKIHGVFEQDPQAHIVGQGCPICGRIIQDEKRRMGITEFIKRSEEIHGKGKYDYSKVVYNTSLENVIIICKIHGEFKQLPSHHMRGVGCPKCSESKGERAIRLFLESHNIQYESQKRFPDCKRKGALSFDFYLPHNNILIEFDGEQHYKPWGFDKVDKRLEDVKLHDCIKNWYCLTNKISLIRIPYTDIDKVSLILDSFLVYK